VLQKIKMNPTKTLPETYSLAWAVDMKKDTRLNWILQLVGMVWFIIAGWVLWKIVSFFRPDFVPQTQFEMSLTLLGGILLVILITLILHELIHGLFFWLFTRERPEFGLGPGYAYAAAPDWYFPKGKYLIIGLSPLMVLTVLGLAVISFVPAAWIGILFLAIVFNAGGAVGDLYICIRIGVERPDVWIKDKGDGFEVYRRDNVKMPLVEK
jgi:hypothetical protein